MNTLSKTCTVIVFTATLTLASPARAGVNEQVLYTFGGSNGTLPEGKLVYTASGQLFGTAGFGGNTTTCENGSNGCGVVFELTPPHHGVRNYHVLHVFNGAPSDGELPLGNIVFDAAGNLYGVTEYGGPSAGYYGDGTVYKLSPAGGGNWNETVIHTFGNGSDGKWPLSGLTADAAGNLYGTTSVGGASDRGAVYQLTPNSNGSWSETILYSFTGQNGDGSEPAGEVIFDPAGNIYGTTVLGGTFNFGLVFELSPSSSGWTKTILYNFTGVKGLGGGAGPLVRDAAGNLYGTSGPTGGAGGAVFELTQNSDGTWTENTIHKFGSYPADGQSPSSGLTVDSAGAFYGTTLFGGAIYTGTVYSLTPKSGGGWIYRQLYNFDGVVQLKPDGGITLGKAHTLFGVTLDDTTPYSGGVYEITF